MHNKEVILVWLPSIGLFGHTYLSGLASQPSPRTKPERRRREGPPQPRATKVPGHQLMGQGDPSARLPFPEGQAALFGDLCSMHTPVPPIPMLWAQVSAPSLGTRKEQKSTRALCWSSPLPAAGVPAGEVLLTHPVTAAFCPTAGLLLWGAGLPLVAASLFNPQLQKAVCGQKRWLAGASEAPGDGCLGLGLWLAHRAASPCPRRGC